MINLLYIKHNKEEIARKRNEISKILKSNSTSFNSNSIKTMSTADLDLLFRLYDKMFSANWFAEVFKGKIKFSLSRRMTRSAGFTLCPKNISKINQEDLIIEIRIGVDFFFQYDLVEGNKAVCGIKTSNGLEALQIVFEHELCHVIEYISFYNSNCSGDRFKEIANNIFAHTESYHKLPTNREIAKHKFGLSIGDTVSFSFEGKNLTGIVYNINKRATVMVKSKDGQFVDEQGKRHNKYYVPLVHLK